MKAALQNRIERLKAVREGVKGISSVVSKVVEENKEVLLSLNRDQMLLGRDAEGNVLGPSYLQDPYFKSKEAAESYARMKERLEQEHRSFIWNTTPLYPDKDRHTPNLIVTGLFQDMMFITTNTNSYTIGSTYVDASDINQKYNDVVFGLAPKSREYFYLEYIRPAILKSLKK